LIQVANHDSKSALPIQFVAFDKLDDSQKINVNRFAALVKEKFITVPVSNQDKMKPSDVVKKVQALLGNPKVNKNGKEMDQFNADTHTRCWKHYQVRPIKGACKPELTKSKYCIYDALNNNYGYTEDWVDFLVDELNSAVKFSELYNK
jgi:hypothetical protein